MNKWRDCGEEGDPRLDGNCRWCGAKLRQMRFSNDKTRLGDYGDGHFCGLRCGFLFGRWFAEAGRRLNPTPKG